MNAELEPGSAFLRDSHPVLFDFVLKLKNIEMIEQSPYELVICIVVPQSQANQVLLELKSEVEIVETISWAHLNHQIRIRTGGSQFPVERFAQLGIIANLQRVEMFELSDERN